MVSNSANCAASLVDLTFSESDDGETPALICSVCLGATGRLVRCTGPCLRTYHIPSAAEEHASCNVLDLDSSEGDAIWRRRESFLCPFCALPSQKACSQCKTPEGELTPCSVGGCGHRFCQSCRSDPSMAFGFAAGIFICPHHFCSHCKMLEPPSENNPLMPCLLCPKAYHLRCMSPRINQETENRIHVHSEHLQEPSIFSKDVMICTSHGISLEQYWQNLLKDWNESWFTSFTETPPRAALVVAPWVPQMDAPVEESPQSNSAELDFETVLGPRPECAQEVYGFYTEAVEQSWKLRDAEEPSGCFPYDNTPSLISPDLLEEFKRTLRLAQSKPQNAQDLISIPYLRKMKRYRESMRYYLCPLHHRGGYTSFGRHFTKPDVLQKIATQVTGLMRNGHMLVDMTCGRNNFLPLVKQFCKEQDIQVHTNPHGCHRAALVAVIEGRAYDILTPSCLEDWVRRSWFDVAPEELNPGDSLVIGLNPPFGTNGRLAEMFIQRAAEFQARHIILITPPVTSIPLGYEVIYEDKRICGNSAFSTPAGRDSRNSSVPTLRLLERREPPLPTDCRSVAPAQLPGQLMEPDMEESFHQPSALNMPQPPERVQSRFDGWNRYGGRGSSKGYGWKPAPLKDPISSQRLQFRGADHQGSRSRRNRRWRPDRPWCRPRAPTPTQTPPVPTNQGFGQRSQSGRGSMASRRSSCRRQLMGRSTPVEPPTKLQRQKNHWIQPPGPFQQPPPPEAPESNPANWWNVERPEIGGRPTNMAFPFPGQPPHLEPSSRFPYEAREAPSRERAAFSRLQAPVEQGEPLWTGPLPGGQPVLLRDWGHHQEGHLQNPAIEEIAPPTAQQHSMMDTSAVEYSHPVMQHSLQRPMRHPSDSFYAPARASTQQQALMNPRAMPRAHAPLQFHVGALHQTLNIHVHPRQDASRKRKLQTLSALFKSVEDLMDDSKDDPFY